MREQRTNFHKAGRNFLYFYKLLNNDKIHH
jgi:hypothetical protein